MSHAWGQHSDTGGEYPAAVAMGVSSDIHINGYAASIGVLAMTEAPPPPSNDNPNATFQDDADKVLRLGRIVTSFKRIGLAIRDPRCKRPHLCVLYALMEKLHVKTATAFLGRRTIAKQESLSEKTVENVLYDLRSWHYIDWERRAEPDLHEGRLLHYTLPVARWTDQELLDAILAQRAKIRGESPRPNGDSESPSRRGERVPVPAGRVPVPTGRKSPRPDGVRNLQRESEDVISVVGDAQRAFALYAATAARCGLPVPKNPKSSLAVIAARLLDSGGLDGWVEMLVQVERSPFLRGASESGFRATVGWLTKPENYLRVLDGEFAPWRGAAVAGPQSFDEDLQELAASPTGRAILAKDGADKGMERLRTMVTEFRRRMRRD